MGNGGKRWFPSCRRRTSRGGKGHPSRRRQPSKNERVEGGTLLALTQETVNEKETQETAGGVRQYAAREGGISRRKNLLEKERSPTERPSTVLDLISVRGLFWNPKGPQVTSKSGTSRLVKSPQQIWVCEEKGEPSGDPPVKNPSGSREGAFFTHSQREKSPVSRIRRRLPPVNLFRAWKILRYHEDGQGGQPQAVHLPTLRTDKSSERGIKDRPGKSLELGPWPFLDARRQRSYSSDSIGPQIRALEKTARLDRGRCGSERYKSE